MKVKLHCSVCDRLIFERKIVSLLVKKHTCPECNSILDTVVNQKGRVLLVVLAAATIIITALLLQFPLVLKKDVSITLILSGSITIFVFAALWIISKNIETKLFNPMAKSDDLRRGILKNRFFYITVSLLCMAGGVACYFIGGTSIATAASIGFITPLICTVLWIAGCRED